MALKLTAFGWGSLSRFHARAAYARTVENSVYVDPLLHRRGIGRLLLADLWQHGDLNAALRAQRKVRNSLYYELRRCGLPTMGELGYKKLNLDFWHMLLAPTGTPRPIIDRLNAALRHALADDKVKKIFGCFFIDRLCKM